MIQLASETRGAKEKLDVLRNEGWIPGVLYGPKTQAASVKVNEKEFGKIYEQAGESSLVSLRSGKGAAPVLIREIQRDPVKGRVLHVDFYQPPLDEKIEVSVPLVFEGEAPAQKDLGGTLLKNIQEVEVKALPQNLPHEITVDISKLATFEDQILARDLTVPEGVEVMREPDEVVAQVAQAQDVEAELEKPVEQGAPEPEVEGAKKETDEEKKEEEAREKLKTQKSNLRTTA